jgi:hypothetical protein
MKFNSEFIKAIAFSFTQYGRELARLCRFKEEQKLRAERETENIIANIGEAEYQRIKEVAEKCHLSVGEVYHITERLKWSGVSASEAGKKLKDAMEKINASNN